MRSPDIVFRVYTKEPNTRNFDLKGELIIIKAKSLKVLLGKLDKILLLDKIVYTNKRGTMITRIYHENKLKKEVRIYPDKRTGKNDHARL